jgi:hypothetical protein
VKKAVLGRGREGDAVGAQHRASSRGLRRGGATGRRRCGGLRVLCSVGVIDEAFDLPVTEEQIAFRVAHVDAVVVLPVWVDVPRAGGRNYLRVQSERVDVEVQHGRWVVDAAPAICLDVGISRREPRLHERDLLDAEACEAAIGVGSVISGAAFCAAAALNSMRACESLALSCWRSTPKVLNFAALMSTRALANEAGI